MMMQNLVFNILLALVVAIVGIVAKTLLPYLRQKKEELNATIRATKWSWAADIIDAVVHAVEQTVEEDLHGEGKKEVAMQYIRDILAQAGLTLSDVEINTLIEAAVHAMNGNVLEVEPVNVLVDDGGAVE